MTSTGFSAHTLVRLCRSRRARIQTQTARTSTAGGHTQRSTSAEASGATGSSTAATAMTTAGTRAQRCGWSVNRMDSTANSVHPIAKPNRTIAVAKLSSTLPAGTNGKITAAANPAASEASKTGPTRLRRGSGVAGGTGSTLGGAVPLRTLMTDHLAWELRRSVFEHAPRWRPEGM